jgi:hypothetical protein
MDQILVRLTREVYFFFLNRYSDYNQIVVDPTDQEKTAFTSPFVKKIMDLFKKIMDIFYKKIKIGQLFLNFLKIINKVNN